MNTGKKYQTKQKQVILQCMKDYAESYITIPQLEELLKEKGQRVGLTTIYRNLDKLEAEHKLIKVNIEGYHGACYKYLPEEDGSLFYLKCEDCGNVVNIECPELEHLYSHVVEEHHVKINPVKTMFYGKCEACTDES